MKKTLLFLYLFISLIIFSCSKKEVSKNNTFNLNLNQGIETLEPVMSNSVQSIWGLSVMMEGLVQFDKESKLKPCITKSWTISEDALIYTFSLRNDVRFQDNECFGSSGGKGRKVTASDFKYCFERVNNPETKTRGLWVFRDKIKGAKEFIDYKSSISSVEVKEITEEEKNNLLAEAKDKRIVMIILKCLFKANEFYHSANIGSYKVDEVKITLGLTPGVDISFEKKV